MKKRLFLCLDISGYMIGIEWFLDLFTPVSNNYKKYNSENA
ncbi:hypothetical protein SAMN05444338_103156 [Flavobacterium degerlachei]|jgi:hypothetical protein|uniref:Uncharacterized protein n=1 Tax=Flavobacterium degerlachei TaxID=229203 RepID=A0A1H2UF83_9FLAO|nr:hypothetical protein SAMN05444338_103156 [Flavobacterium degerlachei]